MVSTKDVFVFLSDIMLATSKISVERVIKKYFFEDFLLGKSLSSKRRDYNNFFYSEDYDPFCQKMCDYINKKTISGECGFYLDATGDYCLNDTVEIGAASHEFLSYINRCNPSFFEHVCAYVLKLEGFDDITKTSDSNDGGLDFFATKKLHSPIEKLATSEISVWGQAKRYGKTTVGIAALREMIGATEVIRCGGYRELPEGIKGPTVDYSKCKPFAPHARLFITSGVFSKNAKKLAEWWGMRMIDGEELAIIFNHYEKGFIRSESGVFFDKKIFRKIVDRHATQMHV